MTPTDQPAPPAENSASVLAGSCPTEGKETRDLNKSPLPDDVASLVERANYLVPGDDVYLTKHEAVIRELRDAITTQAQRIEELTAERDEAREGESRWLTRVHNIRYASGVGARPMLDELPAAIAERLHASEARATRAEGERDEARAETALVIDMHRELASWADHRHCLSDDGHLQLQRRARVAEARILSLEADKRRLDWLELHTVEVRCPLVHGSRHLFFANPDDSFEGEERPSDIRAKIDATQSKEPGDAE